MNLFLLRHSCANCLICGCACIYTGQYERLWVSRAFKILERLNVELEIEGDRPRATGLAQDSFSPQLLSLLSMLCLIACWGHLACAKDISGSSFAVTWFLLDLATLPLLKPVRRTSKRFLPKCDLCALPAVSLTRARAAFLMNRGEAWE